MREEERKGERGKKSDQQRESEKIRTIERGRENQNMRERERERERVKIDRSPFSNFDSLAKLFFHF